MMVSKRRTFSAGFKFDTVMELLTGEKAASQICREQAITDKLHVIRRYIRYRKNLNTLRLGSGFSYSCQLACLFNTPGMATLYPYAQDVPKNFLGERENRYHHATFCLLGADSERIGKPWTGVIRRGLLKAPQQAVGMFYFFLSTCSCTQIRNEA